MLACTTSCCAMISGWANFMCTVTTISTSVRVSLARSIYKLKLLSSPKWPGQTICARPSVCLAARIALTANCTGAAFVQLWPMCIFWAHFYLWFSDNIFCEYCAENWWNREIVANYFVNSTEKMATTSSESVWNSKLPVQHDICVSCLFMYLFAASVVIKLTLLAKLKLAIFSTYLAHKRYSETANIIPMKRSIIRTLTVY